MPSSKSKETTEDTSSQSKKTKTNKYNYTPQAFKILSWNIMNQYGSHDAKYLTDNKGRIEKIKEEIRTQNCDIICLQEADHSLEQLKGYQCLSTAWKDYDKTEDNQKNPPKKEKVFGNIILVKEKHKDKFSAWFRNTREVDSVGNNITDGYKHQIADSYTMQSARKEPIPFNGIRHKETGAIIMNLHLNMNFPLVTPNLEQVCKKLYTLLQPNENDLTEKALGGKQCLLVGDFNQGPFFTSVGKPIPWQEEPSSEWNKVKMLLRGVIYDPEEGPEAKNNDNFFTNNNDNDTEMKDNTTVGYNKEEDNELISFPEGEVKHLLNLIPVCYKQKGKNNIQYGTHIKTQDNSNNVISVIYDHIFHTPYVTIKLANNILQENMKKTLPIYAYVEVLKKALDTIIKGLKQDNNKKNKKQEVPKQTLRQAVDDVLNKLTYTDTSHKEKLEAIFSTMKWYDKKLPFSGFEPNYEKIESDDKKPQQKLVGYTIQLKDIEEKAKIKISKYGIDLKEKGPFVFDITKSDDTKTLLSDHSLLTFEASFTKAEKKKTEQE